jgi:hypothetical protein
MEKELISSMIPDDKNASCPTVPGDNDNSSNLQALE